MSETIRFAFGTPENPGSSVWRLVLTNKGDVYVNNAPAAGNEIHIALHASGKCSLKLGRMRETLLPLDVTSPLHLALAIFYYDWARPHPPLPATGQTNEIIWLGNPKEQWSYWVKIFYTQKSRTLSADGNDIVIFGPLEIKLRSRPSALWGVLEHRQLSEQELLEVTNHPGELIEFNHPQPTHLEMFRISKSQGINIVVHEKYRTSS